MISCDCDGDFEVRAVGDQRLVTCRTPRRCSDCREPIAAGDVMYIQSMYDYSADKPSSPRYHCEPCGDLIESLFDAGYCVEYGNIRSEWKELRGDA